jgi:anti-sigma factor RsiW
LNCDGFEALLERYLTRDLILNERRTAEDHLGACPRCRRLLEIASGERNLLPLGIEGELTRSILERTSGSACQRARTLLCDSSDGILDGRDAEILKLHTDHCPKCNAIAQILVELGAALPSMAEIDPGADFTAAVLGATEGARLPFRIRVREWWSGLTRRPRFSWEAAYAGALLFFIAIGNLPGPLQDRSMAQIANADLPAKALSSATQYLPRDLTERRTRAVEMTKKISSDLSARGQEIARSLAEWQPVSLTIDSGLNKETITKLYREKVVGSLERIWFRLKAEEKTTKPHENSR